MTRFRDSVRVFNIAEITGPIFSSHYLIHMFTQKPFKYTDLVLKNNLILFFNKCRKQLLLNIFANHDILLASSSLWKCMPALITFGCSKHSKNLLKIHQRKHSLSINYRPDSKYSKSGDKNTTCLSDRQTPFASSL